MMEGIHDRRPSPIAGQWYSANAPALAEQVDRYLDNAELPVLEGEVVAVVAPHAGHIYSGPVAGYAFASVQGREPDMVVVASPMHHPYFEPLLTTAHDAYTTPLGDIPVDQVAVESLDGLLQEELGFGLKRVARDMEHSLEIELPFLQRALAKPFKLLPVMVRDQGERVARALGDALASLISGECDLPGRDVLLVASTDLSHFYTQQEAERLDGEILRHVEAFDPAGVLRAEETGKGFACGRGALAAVMWAASGLGAEGVQVLNYATSGNINGDYSRVVGYSAAAILR